MKQELLVTRDPWQTQVAVLEDGRLTEFHQEPSHLEGLVGNLFVGKVNRILPGMESAFVDIGLDRDGFLFEGDMGPSWIIDSNGNGEEGDGRSKKPSVKDLREGDRILVQVTKEPMGPKGARLSTQIALPGSYVIYMPFMDHVGVSRKIAGSERGRLKDLIRKLKGDMSAGFIARTAAEGVSEEEIASEMQALADLWSLIRTRSRLCTAPACVHQEADLVARMLREVLLKGDGRVLTDDPDLHAQCLESVSGLSLDPARIGLWSGPAGSLFDHHHVQEDIEKALRPKVWLPSGGCIVLQSTEALVAIDVNSGRYTGKRSLEETAFAINSEAVDEIVRQIRLRGLGGIIVIDFIDMTRKAHREALIQRLGEALKRDRSRSRILAISEFGLVEMTRKRSHKSLERTMTTACPCCEGRGRVAAPWRTAQQVAYALAGAKGRGAVRVLVSPDVYRYIKDNAERLAFPATVRFESRSLTHPAHFELEPLDR